MTTTATGQIDDRELRLGPGAGTVVTACGVLAAIALALAAAWDWFASGNLHAFLGAYLVSACFVLSLALGALFFVMLHHLARAGWSVVVRRLAEAIAATLPLIAILFLPVLVGVGQLYHWAGHAEHDAILEAKRPYLNVPFFVARVAAYFVIWSFLARYLYRLSLRQDDSGDAALSLRMQAVSAPGMLVFGLTITAAAIDLLMSLDPHWYSTIFGVYFFSGGVVGFFAAIILATVLIQGTGRLSGFVTIEHYHDLGKYLFAFIVFWTYIAYSQYMLIWYGNIPEETQWYLKRQSNGWEWVSLVLLMAHFVVPFLALLSRVPKRRPGVLAAAAIWALAVHWLDVYWLAMPELSPGTVRFGGLEVLCLVGLGAALVAGTVQQLRRGTLIPCRDPRLPESVAFENI